MTPDKLARAYNKALKFGADQFDVDTLLRAHRQNPDDHVTKMALTDALMERGRDREAGLLQSGHPYYHWNGGLHEVHPGLRGPTGESHLRSFVQGYYGAAMRHSLGSNGLPLHLNHGYDRLDRVEPRTFNEMDADAQHFLNSHYASVTASLFSFYSAGEHFWRGRNGHPEAFTAEHVHPGRTQLLQRLANAAGPYTLTEHPDGVVRGQGGDHHWGQQPG